MIKAFIFDLYGTLLQTSGPAAHRRLPRLLGISGREWIRFVRQELMVRSFESPEAFARFVCDSLAPGHGDSLIRECSEVLREEQQNATVTAGAPTLLSFLANRGFKLALISNLSSAHTEPLDRSGLAKSFDTIYLSSEEGRTKPDPEVFHTVLDRLDLNPREAVMVGDSLQNDVEAARAAGLHAVGVGTAERTGWLADVSLVGLLDFSELRPLIDLTGRGPLSFDRIEPVADAEQGSYNLVYRLEGQNGRSFLKRFALRESVAVEELAYTLQAETGLGQCRARAIDATEPLLVIDSAPGEKWPGTIDPGISYEIGRHMTFAFIFSNADARPRNAFLANVDGIPRIQMIDLEHCFFDLAIDTEGIVDPYDPHVLDAVPDLSSRVRKRVLTERATRRARRSFLKEEEHGQHNLAAFGHGWCDYYHELKSRKRELIDLLRERVHREPYLIIGTRAYRRAMADIDVDAIANRLDESPELNFERYQ